MLRTMWMTMALGAGVGLAAGAHAEGITGVPPAKQALVQRVLDKMGLESVGLQMLQAPVADMLRQSRVVVQSRVPADKQDATMKDITAEATKFVEQESPGLRTSTRAIVQSSVAPLLAQKFSEDELKQLAGILESPVLAKFESVVPEMKKAVGENVAKANAAQIQPKMTALQNRVGLKLRAAVGQ
ncbi:DUF2059 domain-containing protein [Massilia sp. CT11-137]|uniref:DUF2059 domain-containing protein n=1 Tax=Massilia sp. CT11-137 TaxID=3393901 RepID=UPI0039AFE2EB